MRGQVLHQCKMLISNRVSWKSNHLRASSVAFCAQNKLWLQQSHHKSLPYKQQGRLVSTNPSAGMREIFLPGNIVQSNSPDIHIPVEPFHEFLFRKLDEFKDTTAMSEFLTGRSYTYSDVKTKSIKVASALTHLGYKKGDTIMAFSTNHTDFPVLMIAASCLGLVFTAANPTFTASELAIQLKGSQAKAVFTTPQLAPIAKEATSIEGVANKRKDVKLFVFGEAEGLHPFQKLLDDDGKAFPDVCINPKEDVYIMPFSSGTTGLPKGVMLTHYNLVANLLQLQDRSSFVQKDNVLGLLPLYHIFGMVVIQFQLLYTGGQIHYLPNFEPESFLRCLQDRKINKVHLVPPLVLFLAKHPMVSQFDLSHLTWLVCSAAPLGKELTLELKKRFANGIVVNQGYGLTELSPASHIDNEGNVGSVGLPLCNTLSKIVDLDTGESLGPDQKGEVWVKGPQVMKGYLNNKKATDDMVDSDGWLRTGDIGYYDEKGLFFICDRLKELIKYKGAQIAPAELEALLLGHAAVQDVAVTGIPDVAAGELPRAYVVKKPNSSVVEEDLIKYVEENVSPSKRLRGGVRFVVEIPKNPSGKILRRLLKTKV